MGRLAPLLVAVAVLAAACSDDTATPDPSPSTTGTSPASSTEPPPTSTTTTAEPTPPPTTHDVAVTIRAGSSADETVVRDVAVTYLGVTLGSEPDRPVVDFEGVAGPASGNHLAATPVTYDDSPDDAWPRDQNGSLVRTLTSDILPMFEYEDGRRTGLAMDGADLLFITDVGISGTLVPVVWKLVSTDDEHLVVRVDTEFEEESIQRGYRFVTAGTVTGEFRVARTNGMDLEGRLDIVFDLIDDAGESARHQWWEATPAPAPPDPAGWRVASDGIARFSEVIAEPTDEPDAFRARFGYGGAAWDGRLEIERFWTQATRTVQPTTVRATLDVESRFAPDGQWLSLDLAEWEADGPPFGTASDDDGPHALDAPPFALIVAADGRIGDAYPISSDERSSRDLRLWFGQVLLEALPSLPDAMVGPGSQWQSRVQGEEDGAGPVFTVIEVVGDELHLEVGGSFGAYFGDRYDGYTVDAEIAGTIVLHWGAAIPLAVYLETTGTITFATGGEPDPSTTEPWRSTLEITAIPANE